MNPVCALCEQPKVLRNSHIIPEFLFGPLYDSKNRYIGITGYGRFGRKFLQKGMTEKLLCDDCEQFLNKHYEYPFKQYWYDRKPLPPQLGWNGIRLQGINYPLFKLFHLSILFRASVARGSTFKDVSLGPHEERVRQLLKAGDPGLVSEYPIFGFVLVDDLNKPMHKIMIPPYKARFEGHVVYQAIFGGCMWVYTVSKHVSKLMMRVSLQPSGSLCLATESWKEVQVIQDASKVLKKFDSI